jgi:hypothetical protein
MYFILGPEACDILLAVHRPGGIRQQFRVAQPLVESILRRVKQAEGLEGPLSAEIWDQGDAVAAYSGTKVVALLFPTAESMDRVRVDMQGVNCIMSFVWYAQCRAGVYEGSGEVC